MLDLVVMTADDGICRVLEWYGWRCEVRVKVARLLSMPLA